MHTTRLVERADVLAVEEVVVGELEDEIDEEAAPDHDVVEHRPVRRVQRDLGCNSIDILNFGCKSGTNSGWSLFWDNFSTRTSQNFTFHV